MGSKEAERISPYFTEGETDPRANTGVSQIIRSIKNAAWMPWPVDTWLGPRRDHLDRGLTLELWKHHCPCVSAKTPPPMSTLSPFPQASHLLDTWNSIVFLFNRTYPRCATCY